MKDNPIKLILIDIDGVVYNYVDHLLNNYFAHLGKTQEDITDYNMTQSLGIDKSEFWKVCDSADGVFCDGDLYPWAQNLVDLCKRFSPSIAFCSNPGNNPKHWAEKKCFIDKFFNGMPLITTQNKEALSLDGVVLIDDFEKNYNNFNKGTGICILFPRYWNMNRVKPMIDDPVGYVECSLEDIAMTGFKNYKGGKC